MWRLRTRSPRPGDREAHERGRHVRSPPLVLPAFLDASSLISPEPGGFALHSVRGIRVRVSASGGLQAAPRLGGTPSPARIPSHLGTGYLFFRAGSVWRAEHWLSPLRPLFSMASGAGPELVFGSDRIFVREPSGIREAYDVESGASLGVETLPPSPLVVSYAATDAHRAVAVADLHGLAATEDGGDTWRSIPVTFDPESVSVEDGSFVVRGRGPSRRPLVSQLTSDFHPLPAEDTKKEPALAYSPPRSIPLRQALATGVPVAGGRALYVEGTDLVRVRLSDGEVEKRTERALARSFARCQGAEGEAGAAMFVCGSPQGDSAVYAVRGERLWEILRTETPRVITPSAAGLLFGGRCHSDEPSRNTVCAAQRGRKEEYRLQGGGGSERVILRRDGRLTVLSPPARDLRTLRLTHFRAGKPVTLPIKVPTELSPEVEVHLREGTWTQGFEERGHQAVGGWVEGRGTFLGVEISDDGELRVGEFIRDLGVVTVAGRFGLGLHASRRGFRTTNGGMTWRHNLDVPEPLAPKADQSAHCGPIGCLLGGWMVLGWGDALGEADLPKPPTPRKATDEAAVISLDCRAEKAPKRDGREASARLLGASSGASFGRMSFVPWQPGARSLPPFLGVAAPTLANDEVGFYLPAQDPSGRPAAQLYLWGPSADEWSSRGGWLARFRPMFHPQPFATRTGRPPARTLEAAKQLLGLTQGSFFRWQFFPGQTPSRGLLAGRRPGGDTLLLELREGVTPSPLQRDDTLPIPEVETATEMQGRWYIATAQGAGEPSSTNLWREEGGLLHLVYSTPRVPLPETWRGRLPTRLATHSDGRRIALVVSAPPQGRRPSHWLLAVDTSTGVAESPVPFPSLGLRNMGSLPCGAGWRIDLPVPGVVEIDETPSKGEVASLGSPWLRGVVDRDRVCVESMHGGVSDDFSVPTGKIPSGIPVLVRNGESQDLLQCVAKLKGGIQN